MKLLIIDTLAEPGHRSFNSSIIKILSDLFEIRVLGFHTYFLEMGLGLDYSIPEELRGFGSKGRFRLNQMKILSKVRNVLNDESFDAAVFLSYENISLSLVWPNLINTIVFPHNNLERLEEHASERILYRIRSKSICHASFTNDMINYVEKLGLTGKLVPHPLPLYLDPNQRSPTYEKGLIFAPSGSNDFSCINRFAARLEGAGKYRLFAKYPKEVTIGQSVLKPRFDNYLDILRSSEYVLLPGGFKNRVSNVFYESMTLRKKILATASPFMNAMKREYPHSIQIVQDPLELEQIEYHEYGMEADHERFLATHSPQSIGKSIQGIFSSF